MKCNKCGDEVKMGQEYFISIEPKYPNDQINDYGFGFISIPNPEPKIYQQDVCHGGCIPFDYRFSQGDL